MALSQITKSRIPTISDSFANAWQQIQDAVGDLERFVEGRFPTLAALQAAVTSPVRGQPGWIDSPGYPVRWDGLRWRPEGPRTEAFRLPLTTSDKLFTGTNNYDLASQTINRPNEPYVVTASLGAGINFTGLPGRVSFRIGQVGAGGDYFRGSADCGATTSSANISARQIVMPNGGSCRVFGNIEVAGAFDVFVYAGYFSVLELLVQPYGLNL